MKSLCTILRHRPVQIRASSLQIKAIQFLNFTLDSESASLRVQLELCNLRPARKRFAAQARTLRSPRIGGFRCLLTKELSC